MEDMHRGEIPQPAQARDSLDKMLQRDDLEPGDDSFPIPIVFAGLSKGILVGASVFVSFHIPPI